MLRADHSPPRSSEGVLAESFLAFWEHFTGFNRLIKSRNAMSATDPRNVGLENPPPARAEAGDQRQIYRAVYYFNLFDYPIKLRELVEFSGLRLEVVTQALASLLSANLLEQSGDYVHVPRRAWMIRRREADESFFLLHYQKIRRAAWVLSHLPFVRGIFLTWRTSKGILSPFDDYDFLVLAAKDRARLTWILLFLFRRLISLNYRNGNFRWFCCNYILSEDRLALSERDPFIAMELVCAFPMFNSASLERFRQANEWHREYFHQRGHMLPRDLALSSHCGFVQRLLEIPCNLIWTNSMQRFAENYYRRRWVKLGMVKNEEDYRKKATEGYVKPDTGGRRQFIVDRVERLDPHEHHSFLRTKIHLHRALRHKTDAPDILVTGAGMAWDARQGDEANKLLGHAQRIADYLTERGYRAEVYDATGDPNIIGIFRMIKTRFIPLVAVLVGETTRTNASQMVRLFHSIGARVVVGGPDASQNPELYLNQDADVVLCGGEGQKLFALLEHIHRGTLAIESIAGIHYAGKADRSQACEPN